MWFESPVEGMVEKKAAVVTKVVPSEAEVTEVEVEVREEVEGKVTRAVEVDMLAPLTELLAGKTAAAAMGEANMVEVMKAVGQVAVGLAVVFLAAAQAALWEYGMAHHIRRPLRLLPGM